LVHREAVNRELHSLGKMNARGWNILSKQIKTKKKKKLDMLCMLRIINTYNAIRHHSKCPFPMPMSNKERKCTPKNAVQCNPNAKPNAKPNNAFRKLLDVAYPTSDPWIVGQLLPLLRFGDAFQQSPIINNNPFFLPSSR
jgi:hypothetical protein